MVVAAIVVVAIRRSARSALSFCRSFVFRLVLRTIARSSSCGVCVCDGAALSHVKHRPVSLITNNGVAIGGGGVVVVVVDMYRLTNCGQT